MAQVWCPGRLWDLGGAVGAWAGVVEVLMCVVAPRGRVFRVVRLSAPLFGVGGIVP